MRYFPAASLRELRETPYTKHWIIQSAAMRTATLVMEPGFKVPVHAHARSEEVFVILAGEGVAIMDGVETRVSAGDALVTEPGVFHSFEVTGPEPMLLLAIVAPNLEDTVTQTDVG